MDYEVQQVEDDYDPHADAPDAGPRELPLYERQKLAAEKEYAVVRAMVAASRDVGPMRIARKLSIPYSRASAMYSKAHHELFVAPPTRMDPEADAALKDELTEILAKAVGKHAESLDAGELGPRSETNLLSATKQLSKMRGYDAPTRSENVEWKLHALNDPEVQARIMKNADARAAFLIVEEFANSGQIALDPPDPGEDGDR